MTATITKPTYVEGRLPVLLSCRVRLSEEQRNTLKAAYDAHRAKAQSNSGARIGGSTVVTTTMHQTDVAGLSGFLLSDLFNSRDSIQLTLILKIQKALGVEVITRKDVEEAASSYVSYVFSTFDD
jgi:hypothetical protein